ncbi:DMT family transporter [Burkholderia stagnalis]|uniref:DMT family transporter n=1 Tax=Burkholderia stagnalis TaxID=1503054 RepID=A0ABX9YDH0_9BURK|nr:DMT family transporter [Burkholderia stagnalis]RQQ47551.1 hypothetical protein DF158_33840 [Burkholderia stagnalis]RQQ59050.1 hypothetical protein DF137_34335 [Burkholderia stagnalis]RQQ59575.1 hypothetical protein DF139_33865 [Burkholderia stagnalis]RQQ73884.1 hypothetical protein DF138_33685 [Burkholderia stagnalis]RQQ79670.1 hypothetical protein DF136_34250 [Burkholderia stagnalis]
MSIYIVIALLNGGIVCLSRMVNRHLDLTHAPIWNLLIGLLFLTILSVEVWDWQRAAQVASPAYMYIAGTFGTLFVTVSSFMLSRLDTTLPMLIVICGQMFTAVLLDILQGGTAPGRLCCLGAAAVVAGLCLDREISSPK